MKSCLNYPIFIKANKNIFVVKFVGICYNFITSKLLI